MSAQRERGRQPYLDTSAENQSIHPSPVMLPHDRLTQHRISFQNLPVSSSSPQHHFQPNPTQQSLLQQQLLMQQQQQQQLQQYQQQQQQPSQAPNFSPVRQQTTIDSDTVNALQSCILSSVQKSKIQELKIQELEGMITSLQNNHNYSHSFSGNKPTTSPSHYPFNQSINQAETYRIPSTASFSPCKRHEPTLTQSQSMKKPANTLRSSQKGQSPPGRPNPSPTRWNPNNQQESLSYSTLSNPGGFQSEYISKMRFLEEAIELKNKEIDDLMVLTAVTQKSNASSLNNPMGITTPAAGTAVYDIQLDTPSSIGLPHRCSYQAMCRDLQKQNAQLQDELYELTQRLQNQYTTAPGMMSMESDTQRRHRDEVEQTLLTEIEQQAHIIKSLDDEKQRLVSDYEGIIAMLKQEIDRNEGLHPDVLTHQQDLLNQQAPNDNGLPAHLLCREYEIQLAEQKEQMLSLYDKIDVQTDLISKYKQVIDGMRGEMDEQNRKFVYQQAEQLNQISAQRTQDDQDLTAVKGENAQLKSLLVEKNTEIAQIAKQLEDTTIKGNNAFQEYEKSLKEITGLLESQKTQNAALKDENGQLILIKQKLQGEIQQLIEEAQRSMKADSDEISDLKKQLVTLSLQQGDLDKKNTLAQNKHSQISDLLKENAELKQTIEQFKTKITTIQHIDDELKEYIAEICDEKNSLQDKQQAQSENIKSLRLQLRSSQLENSSLMQSLATLKEELTKSSGFKADIEQDETSRKALAKVHAQKKINAFNTQLEQYVRSTLDLDEIYYILLFSPAPPTSTSTSSPSPFTSPQKGPFISSYLQNSSSGKKPPTQQHHSLSKSAHTNNNQNFNSHNVSGQKAKINGSVVHFANEQLDEKTRLKIESLNQKRKRDLDKLYAIMEELVSTLEISQA